ncbi:MULTISPECIES: ATP-binding response regulator [Methanobacterium]|jgi:PAS domain S-box-containing protein|uniref:Histidine kinase n=1 Tax=Methanobacterium bryantii TaxID=2161 RepID=A0A2A2H5Y6_METBR|nr:MULTISPECIES: response regulator [Methanobacterium]OEC84548.1 histidine kinase [Methanobacterium sp. A39]PAV04849.1 histidine kinase [Methanobacterium bryantii]
MAAAQIMVVEDERITAKDIQSALESAGYGVADLVFSGEDAVRKAGELQPDLVLMDIKLEGEMDGIEAATQIRERYDIPVIYLTAYSSASIVQRAKMTEPAGYLLKEQFGFLTKPFEESELNTTIEIALYNHKIEKRLRNREQWLAAILKSVSDAVIATDSKGRIKYMNPVAEELTGWIQEEAIGEDLDKILKILSKESTNIESGITSTDFFDKTVIRAKDGTKLLVGGSTTPIKDEKGNSDGLVVVFRKYRLN